MWLKSSVLPLLVPSLLPAHTLVNVPLLNSPGIILIRMRHLFPAGTLLNYLVMECVHVGLVAAS